MEGRPPKVTKEVLCEEARFILANVLAEGRYGRQNKLADIRRICEGAVSIPFTDYVQFLESAGYLTHDKAQDTLDVTQDGERVVTGERLNELLERAVAHFKARRAAGGGAAGAGAVSRMVTTGSSAAIPAARETQSGSIVSSSSASLVARGEIRSSQATGSHMVPRYEKVALIGSGGIGSVYVARQLPLEREVALKEIREVFNFFSDEARREIVRRFGEVTRAAARLSHPNIVPLHDVVAEREVPYVVSEYLTQGSVRRLIADAEEIPIGLVVKYLLQALHALKAAHGQNVIHRGLKPENLLIDAHGNVKVSDFGMARIVERDQAIIKQVYIGMGSVAYMAPELFNDPLNAGPQSDIYALGIIFYEMLTRKLPGRRSPLPTQVNKDLPRGIDDLFDRMTHDDKAQRYNHVEDILEDFYKIDGIDKLVEGNYSVLFGDNPIAKLKFKTPLKPVATMTDATNASTPTGASGASSSGAAASSGAGSSGAPSSPGPQGTPSTTTSPPSEPTKTSIGAAAPSVDVSSDSVPPPIDGNGHGEGRRPLGRRPYSYQQRLKDRGS
jgi:eukaryotic-like serine/threonine-protein kinase